MRRLSDDELAALAAAGEGRAFAAIFERYHQPLYRYCTGILRDTDQAADALQNTMIAALRGLEGEERPIALKPWLYRIAHNQSISLLRRRRPDEPLSDGALERLPAVGAAADDAVRERLEELLRDLRSLPEQQRSALLLRELNGLEYAEVGLALSITSNAARQAVFKARQTLHTVVEGRGARCESVQEQMSAHDRRFQRRRDIRAHLDDCPDCTAFATALAQRPRDLEALFPLLPASAAAGMLGGEDDERRRRRPLFLLLLLLLAGTASAAVLAASGVFDSGDGGGRDKPVAEQSPSGGGAGEGGGAATKPAPSHRRHHARRPASGAGGGGSRTPPAAAAATGRVPSAASGYSTPGALTESAVAGSGDCAGSGGRGGGGEGSGGSGGGGGSGSGDASNGSSGDGSASGCAAAGGGGGGLPLTGLALMAVLATALALLGSGLALRRLARP